MRNVGTFRVHIYCICFLSAILLVDVADMASAGSVISCYRDIVVCFAKHTGVTSFTFSNTMSKEMLTKICKNKAEVVPCLHKLPSKCSSIVDSTLMKSLNKCYIPGEINSTLSPTTSEISNALPVDPATVCLDHYESCTLKITGVKMPTDPDEAVLEMSLKQQIDLCRSIPTLEECMMPVHKECTLAMMSPTKLFNQVVHCSKVCLNMFNVCSLNITGIEMPTDPDRNVLDMTIEEQIGLCRSVPLMKDCMTPVKKECAASNMSPESLFSTAARCDEVTEKDVCKMYNETNACENGGSCIAINFYPVCDCEFGFSAEWCETLNCSAILENGNVTAPPEGCLSLVTSGVAADGSVLSVLLLAATLTMRAVLQ